MSDDEPDYFPGNLVRFARLLAAKHEVLQAVLNQHVEDWGEILPTMYLSDVSRKFVELFLSPETRETAISVMRHLEEAMAHDDPAVVNEVGVGFVEMLPYGDELGTEDIRAALSPRLRQSWEETYGPMATP
jgi:hypothetical protein